MGDVGPYKIKWQPTIGRGSFGDVFEAFNMETNEVVAAKRIVPPEDFYRSTVVDNTKREIDVLTKVQGHVNILKIFDSFEKEREFWLMCELCTLGNLNRYTKFYNVNLSHKVHIMFQVASGLTFLHALKPLIVHRDVKPGNTLLTVIDAIHWVKLCDFGLSRPLANLTSMSLTKEVGTSFYKAPELFNKNVADYDEKVDVFAAGVMLDRMMKAEPGRAVDSEDDRTDPIGLIMFNNRKDHVIEPLPNDSELMRAIIALTNSMIKLVKRRRPTMVEVEAELVRIKAELPEAGVPTLRSEDEINGAMGGDSSTGSGRAGSGPGSEGTGSGGTGSGGTGSGATGSDGTGSGATGSDETGNDGPGSDGIGSGETGTIRTGNELSASPPMLSAKPTVKELTGYKLKIHIFATIGFGDDSVMVEQAGVNTQVRMKFEMASKTYLRRGETSWPREVKKDSQKYTMEDGSVIARHRGRNPTYVFDADLHQLTTFSGEFGRLRGTLSPDLLLYAKGGVGQAWDLTLYSLSDHSLVHTLSRSVGSAGISACRHAGSGWLAVVDSEEQTLDIYDAAWSHRARVELPFRPWVKNALCAVGDYIVVAHNDPGQLYVYSWGGVHLTCVNMKGKIYGMAKGGGRRVHVQVYKDADFLYMYHIV